MRKLEINIPMFEIYTCDNEIGIDYENSLNK